MFALCIGIWLEFGGRASICVCPGLSIIDRRVAGIRSCVFVSIPGKLFLVLFWCVCGLFASFFGFVESVVIVTGGAPFVTPLFSCCGRLDLNMPVMCSVIFAGGYVSYSLAIFALLSPAHHALLLHIAPVLARKEYNSVEINQMIRRSETLLFRVQKTCNFGSDQKMVRSTMHL